jgi:class 3 adenylate cyclase
MDDVTGGAPLTVLFSDIEGSTALHARVGDAEARRVLDEYDALVREKVAAHKGEEIKSLGDGMLVTFASTRNAVECAVAIQRAVAGLAAELRVRIGINTGEVVRSDSDVYGAAVNAAARIVAIAQPGQILVADVVRQLLGPVPGVSLGEHGWTELRGLPGETLLHEVRWQEQVASQCEPEQVSRRPPVDLIGRDGPIALLGRMMRRAAEGELQLAFLTGEPGIGKTAVARAASSDASRRGTRVVWATALESSSGMPYWPWAQVVDALRDAPGVGGLDERVTEDAARLHTPRAAQQDSGDDTLRLQMFESVASILHAVAETTPLLIVFDDLQWADTPSLVLLSFVARRLARSRIALLGTVRDRVDNAELAAAMRQGDVVLLDGLDRGSVAALAERLTGTAPDPDLVARLYERTGGNPFFVRELARVDHEGALPHSVRDVIRQRLRHLPTPVQDALGAAAVICSHISVELLAAVTGAGLVELVGWLDDAVRARVLEDPPGPLGPYSFAHDLFRETLYDELDAAHRGQLHLVVGRELRNMQLRGDTVHPADIANHLLRALPLTPPSEMADAACAAAEHALGQFAYEEAVRHYNDTLRVLALDAPAVGRRADVMLALADTHRRAGHRESACAAVDAVIALAREHTLGEQLARALIVRDAMGDTVAEPGVERGRLFEEALAALEAGDSALRAHLMACKARFIFFRAIGMTWDDANAQLAAAAVQMARRVGNPATLTYCLHAHHDVVGGGAGSHELRLALANELVEVATEAGDLEAQFWGHTLRLADLLQRGDPTAGHEVELLAAVASAARLPRLDYFVLVRRAMWATLTGDRATALAVAAEARELGTAIGEPDAPLVYIALSYQLAQETGETRWVIDQLAALPRQNDLAMKARHAQMAPLAYFGGDEQWARAVTAIGIEWAREVVDLNNLSADWVASLMAEPLAALGTSDEARVLYELLLPYLDMCAIGGGAVTFGGHMGYHLGLLAEAMTEHDAAVAHLDQAARVHERLGARPWLARTQVALGRVLLKLGEPRRGGSMLNEGLAAAEVLDMPFAARLAREALGDNASRPQLERDGAVWLCSFAGATLHVKDSKGMHDLARLLGSPNEEVHVAELAGLVAVAGADAVLDDTAKAAFRKRIAELDVELDAADRANDATRSDAAQRERDAVLAELEAALGFGGRDRRLGDPVERARKAVSGRIRDAIGRITAAHHVLGAHLHATVRTGTYCSYRPSQMRSGDRLAPEE